MQKGHFVAAKGFYKYHPGINKTEQAYSHGLAEKFLADSSSLFFQGRKSFFFGDVNYGNRGCGVFKGGIQN